MDKDLGRLKVISYIPIGCVDPTSLWTGWGWLEGCLLFQPPASSLCCFTPLYLHCDLPFSLMSANCLSLSTSCHNQSLIPASVSCPFSWSLWHFLTAPRSCILCVSWGKLLLASYVFHLCDVASPAWLNLKQDGLYAGQVTLLKTDFFVWHVVLPFDARYRTQAAQVTMLCSSSFQGRIQVSAAYRKVGTTRALYTWIFMDRWSKWLPYSLWLSSNGTAGLAWTILKKMVKRRTTAAGVVFPDYSYHWKWKGQLGLQRVEVKLPQDMHYLLEITVESMGRVWM